MQPPEIREVVAPMLADSGNLKSAGAPTKLRYPHEHAVYTLAKGVAPQAPSSQGGPVVFYSVTPLLPRGLALDPSTGVITGRPLALARPARYTVTAANQAGAASFTLEIAVEAGRPNESLFVSDPEEGIIGVYNVAGAGTNDRFMAELGSLGAIVVNGNELFAANASLGTVAKFDAATGFAIDTEFITGLTGVFALAASGNHLFVGVSVGSTGSVIEYDATTGAVLEANFITDLDHPLAIAIAGDKLLVAGDQIGHIRAYDAATGAVLNYAFIAGVYSVSAMAVSGNKLYLNRSTGSNTETIDTYDAITGASLRARLIKGLPNVTALAATGSRLFVSTAAGTVCEYDSATGAPLHPKVIAKLQHTFGLGVKSELAAPSSLAYSPNPAIYTLGRAFPPIVPSNAGGPVAVYAISPVLPEGLTLDPESGIITGMPTAAAPARNYTVTAVNTLGSATATLNLRIDDKPPLGLAYATAAAVYTLGVPIGDNPPSSSGSPTLSYSITPALPAGLVLNSTTGVISGTPVALSPPTNYTVTATNGGGAGKTELNFAVKVGRPTLFVSEYNPMVGIYDAISGSRFDFGFSPEPSIASALAASKDTVFVADTYAGKVLAYSAATGALLDTHFDTIYYPTSLALSGNTLFVANNVNRIVAAYDAITGAAKEPVITGVTVYALAASGRKLYVAGPGSVGVYDTVTGALLENLIIGVSDPLAIAVAGNILFVANKTSPYFYGGTVTMCDAKTGDVLNAAFISEPFDPFCLALCGNTLFVGSFSADVGGVVGVYDATTGAMLKDRLLTHINGGPLGLAVIPAPGAPLALSYSAGSTVYALGIPIALNIPSSVGGGITEYAVSPPLPAGLELNTFTGVISGIPTAPTPAAKYTITGTNPWGATTAVTNLSVANLPPSALAYAYSTSVFSLDCTITDDSPQSGGSPVVSYSISPPLPAGLAFDPATGVIGGVPTVVAPATDYTVTATNAAGFCTAVLNFAVKVEAPHALSYSTNPAVYEIRAPIQDNVPQSLGSPVTSYSISPALPPGLALDAVTGIISGSPTAAASTTNYTVTARNDGGFATIGLNLTVHPAGPRLLIGQDYGGASSEGNETYGVVDEYDSVSGAAIRPNFLAAINNPVAFALRGNFLFVANSRNQTVSKYDAATGALIKADFITGQQELSGLALSGDKLFVSHLGGAVGEYDAATGAVLKANFVNINLGYWLAGMAVSGNTLFVLDNSNTPDGYTGTIGAYDINTGAVINSRFITYPNVLRSLVIAGHSLLIGSEEFVLAYDLATGALVNPRFVDVAGASALAVSGNTLFVGGETVGAYDATTGAAIDPNFISDVVAVKALVVAAPFGPPSELAKADLPTADFGQSSLQSWRQKYHGTTNNIGAAADTADPHHTGVPNLLAFAFCGPDQSPASARPSQLPQLQMSGGCLFYSFVQPAGISGLTYGAEWSADPGSGSWQPIPDTGSGLQHVFSAPIGTHSRMFLRLTVTNSGP